MITPAFLGGVGEPAPFYLVRVGSMRYLATCAERRSSASRGL